MKTATICKMDNNFERKVLGVVKVVNGKAVIPPSLDFLKEFPLHDEDSNEVSIFEGEKYVECLGRRLTNPYLWAELN